MDEDSSNLPPSWLEPAKRKDLATLTEIAQRSRDLYILVDTSEQASFTIWQVGVFEGPHRVAERVEPRERW
jgi:hypothetical protein